MVPEDTETETSIMLDMTTSTQPNTLSQSIMSAVNLHTFILSIQLNLATNRRELGYIGEIAFTYISRTLIAF